MSMWRNWYTRTFEGRVEQSLRVQVPPSTFFILIIIGCGTQNPTKQSIVIEFNCVSKQSEFEQKDYTA